MLISTKHNLLRFDHLETMGWAFRNFLSVLVLGKVFMTLYNEMLKMLKKIPGLTKC